MIINLAQINFAGGGSGGGMNPETSIVIANALNALYDYMYTEGGLNDRITTLEEGEQV